MPMIEIPYARSEPYDNRDYVARMADLMIRDRKSTRLNSSH